ncbi:MAG TPA: hypothetical protein VLC46_21500 [Thermoanaerobaculia bacterium]|jgi:hypothetical protein|nr:hypothetical protein [Thermoanaerobaculia bacterium]
MTLVVSLLIPDGIVLAGDSLATIETLNTLQGQVDVTCPQCQHQHVVPAVIQGSMIPATSFPYAQKIFPFMKRYGIGTAGSGQLNGKSIYFIMRQLEEEVLRSPKRKQPESVDAVAKLVADRALSLLHDEARAADVDPAIIQNGYVQFQVLGYDGETPKVVRLYVGATVDSPEATNPGSYLIGVSDVSTALWNVRTDIPLYRHFSLQHAVEYAEFLISATASHQRFYGTLPSVGGSIDIALVTPFDGFRWIRQKPLFATITGDIHAKETVASASPPASSKKRAPRSRVVSKRAP